MTTSELAKYLARKYVAEQFYVRTHAVTLSLMERIAAELWERPLSPIFKAFWSAQRPPHLVDGLEDPQGPPVELA